jgi:uridylate kinase
MKYKRILLKLSGESLSGPSHLGIDSERLQAFAKEIKKVHEEGIEVAVVTGGGNIFRGLKGSSQGINRIQGDYMGMLATVINSLAIQTTLAGEGLSVSLFSGIPVEPVAEKISSMKAIQALENGQVVLIAGGTGNPFFTTDSAAVLRALEINADILLKGTRVDGVYSADPEKDPSAVKYSQLTFDKAIEKGLKIMDLTAFTLCKEHKLPVIVFNMNVADNLYRIVKGEKIGTLVEE